MIISCINCNKKFDLNSDLIPESGRLLVCGICNHEWFYKKEVIPNIIQSDNNDNPSFESDEKLVTEKDQGELELFNKTLNPKIVDKNLKIKGLNNIYCCSSAIFPTSGSANPTLIICGLAERLSKFLQ